MRPWSDFSHELAVTVEPANDRTIVTACGEIDMATAPVLRQELMKAQGGPQSDGDRHDVVVDLSGVTFLDARALDVLLAAAMRARRAGTDIVLRNPGRLTLRLLDITGLGPAFTVERDGEDGSTLERAPTGNPRRGGSSSRCWTGGDGGIWSTTAPGARVPRPRTPSSNRVTRGGQSFPGQCEATDGTGLLAARPR